MCPFLNLQFSEKYNRTIHFSATSWKRTNNNMTHSFSVPPLFSLSLSTTSSSAHYQYSLRCVEDEPLVRLNLHRHHQLRTASLQTESSCAVFCPSPRRDTERELYRRQESALLLLRNLVGSKTSNQITLYCHDIHKVAAVRSKTSLAFAGHFLCWLDCSIGVGCGSPCRPAGTSFHRERSER